MSLIRQPLRLYECVLLDCRLVMLLLGHKLPLKGQIFRVEHQMGSVGRTAGVPHVAGFPGFLFWQFQRYPYWLMAESAEGRHSTCAEDKIPLNYPDGAKRFWGGAREGGGPSFMLDELEDYHLDNIVCKDAGSELFPLSKQPRIRRCHLGVVHKLLCKLLYKFSCSARRCKAHLAATHATGLPQKSANLTSWTLRRQTCYKV